MKPGNCYPPLDVKDLIERIDPGNLPRKHRRWKGNDACKRNHHASVRNEGPLYLNLHWKRTREARTHFIGAYRLNVSALLASGYVRSEDESWVRLRFYHAHDGIIYIQANFDGPRIAVGVFPAT